MNLLVHCVNRGNFKNMFGLNKVDKHYNKRFCLFCYQYRDKLYEKNFIENYCIKGKTNGGLYTPHFSNDFSLYYIADFHVYISGLLLEQFLRASSESSLEESNSYYFNHYNSPVYIGLSFKELFLSFIFLYKLKIHLFNKYY
ncbi:hypothetical protein POCGH01_00230100 [Plasmodium ovale]|uniref:PIR protein n=1 Tax=Plasmodium ovale TaxID=36330 RepID=A0A1D3JG75_PLAOA|nr:hypothetical protein POCGH01_00230100 [Plasmodium ovale]